MADTTQSKSHATPTNPFAGFDPAALNKLMADAYSRAQTWSEQYAAMESVFVARAQGAVASWAQLTQDAIAYTAQLAAEARKIGLDAVRKASTAA